MASHFRREALSLAHLFHHNEANVVEANQATMVMAVASHLTIPLTSPNERACRATLLVGQAESFGSQGNRWYNSSWIEWK